MLCCVNYPCKEVESHWLLKENPQIAEGKARERKSLHLASWAAQVRSKKSSLLTLPAPHHCWGSLQPPRARSPGLSPAAPCCCGIGNLLWLRKIMGICFSKPKKSQTKFRKRKKKSTKTADLTGETLGIFLHIATIFFGISWFCDQKNDHIMFIIVVFSGLLVVRGGAVRANRTGSSKVKITSPTCLKAFQAITRLKSFFFRILKTYRNHIQEKMAIVVLDWESKKLLNTVTDTEQSKLYLNELEH